MTPFTKHTGIVAPLDRANVDTDCIIPKQFLRKVDRQGFGKHLFHELRYTDYDGTKENPDFILNQEPYRKATILLGRDNFGCGSSREHAPWALADFGFRCVIAPSFADIFYNNCAKIGILLVKLTSTEVEELFQLTKTNPGFQLTADLEQNKVITLSKKEFMFTLDKFTQDCLLKGLDQIGWTMQYEKMITGHEEKLKKEQPWLS
ncbi:MAG: 3-isopropylmalate dehydratase small subunit [Candidatus Omnitrophica bacterium]|nr:3-isopropylmalate dehydratase small subunit [Candidatus Omnitrophota bacterium]